MSGPEHVDIQYRLIIDLTFSLLVLVYANMLPYFNYSTFNVLVIYVYNCKYILLVAITYILHFSPIKLSCVTESCVTADVTGKLSRFICCQNQ